MATLYAQIPWNQALANVFLLQRCFSIKLKVLCRTETHLPIETARKFRPPIRQTYSDRTCGATGGCLVCFTTVAATFPSDPLTISFSVLTCFSFSRSHFEFFCISADACPVKKIQICSNVNGFPNSGHEWARGSQTFSGKKKTRLHHSTVTSYQRGHIKPLIWVWKMWTNLYPSAKSNRRTLSYQKKSHQRAEVTYPV